MANLIKKSEYVGIIIKGSECNIGSVGKQNTGIKCASPREQHTTPKWGIVGHFRRGGEILQTRRGKRKCWSWQHLSSTTKQWQGWDVRSLRVGYLSRALCNTVAVAADIDTRVYLLRCHRWPGWRSWWAAACTPLIASLRTVDPRTPPTTDRSHCTHLLAITDRSHSPSRNKSNVIRSTREIYNRYV